MFGAPGPTQRDSVQFSFGSRGSGLIELVGATPASTGGHTRTFEFGFEITHPDSESEKNQAPGNQDQRLSRGGECNGSVRDRAYERNFQPGRRLRIVQCFSC